MKILIDFTQIPVEKVGVGIYALNLVSKIYGMDMDNTYFVVIQDDDACLDFMQSSRIKVIKVQSRLFRNHFLMILAEQICIPYFAWKYKIDVVHSLHHSFPLFTKAKKVVVIHDLTFFKCPQYHRPSRKYFFRCFNYLASFFADRIIADSKSSLNDLLQLFRRALGKSSVIYLGKDDSFRPDLDNARIEIIKNKYACAGKYILFLGTLEPRKNIKSLILAFHKISQEFTDYKLVIAGKKGWYYKEILLLPKELNLEEKIIFTGYVDELDKPFLIAGAEIFVYPSMYEGFGIPVLEALACGVPTITSNVSSLPEVAGNAALLVNPSNIEELYISIKRLISDKLLYARLKQLSIEQAGKFSWEKTARETIGVYNSLS